jgi:hypothetical protein
MTKINDYIWHLPHDPLPDDPPDIDLLQQLFNVPIVSLLQENFSHLGYELKSNDVLVRLDEKHDNTANTYYANVRFIRYLGPEVIARVHFQHMEWATYLGESHIHQYAINLDRFKFADPQTQQALPGWEGRLHSRVSNRPEMVLHHDGGEDQIWRFQTPEQLDEQLNLFWEKFIQMGQDWLENMRGL